MAVELGMLGPVEARVDGRLVALGHARQQCVLAALVVDANQPVPAERLACRVWGDQLPRQPRTSLHAYLSRLRHILADAGGPGIRRLHGGYVLTIDPQSVDLNCFGQLVARARASNDDEQARLLFGQALGLWRGGGLRRPGHGLAQLRPRHPAPAAVRSRTGSRRCAAAPWPACRAAGRTVRPRPRLPAGRAPVRPADAGLHRCGRSGDALAQYQISRSQLAAQLGIDPGPGLQRLNQQILAADPALRGPAAPVKSAAGAGPAGPVVPRQLPAPPRLFTGRAGELSGLTGSLPVPGGPGREMVIWAIDGTGGVGKTWLALRWAHDHMSSFPDGQLYINLRGFGRSGSAVSPAEAVRGFLVALGVAAGQIPAGLDAQTGLYRSMLASRRVLVVLDNARDVEQVRPLLPGSACCLVLVTSRSRLTGLVAAEGARPLPLGLLTAGEARDVLAARLGVGRVTAEARAVGEIIDRCARLPLALAIVAARATAHPGCPLAVLAAELRDAEGGLDGFEAADAATDVRTVLSWSYQALSADAAMLFRLLGLYRGPDITPAAAASLAGLSRQRCCRLLAELAGAHLLTEHAPGRYAGHDLLRAFAAELARSHDSEGTRRAAVHRVLDHYLHTATAAVQFLRQHQEREPIALGPPQPGVSPERVSSPEGALAWLTAERPGLVAAVGQAAAADFDAHAWQLAWTLQTFLLRQGLWPEQVAVHRTALAAARRLGDRTGQAHTLAGLAIGYARWGRLDDAVAHYQQALHLYTELGDLTAQAGSCVGLGELAEMQDRPADALGYAQQVLGLYRTAGDREGQASALNGVGWCHALLGDYPQALAHCRKALTLLQDLGAGDGYGAAATWDSLGYIHRGLADYQQAARCYQHAAGLYRDLSDPYFEAGTLTNLGETHRAAGRQGAARQAWEHALSILGRLGHPDADRVRSMIGSLPHPGPAADPRNPVSPV